MAINASAELSVLQAVAQFLTYAVMAVFAENAVFFRALGVSRLNKLVNDPKISTWQYCIPIILVQTISAARFGKGAARLAAGQRPAPAGIFELLTDRYGHCVAAVGHFPQKPRCLPRTAARRNLQLLRAGHPAGCSQPEL